MKIKLKNRTTKIKEENGVKITKTSFSMPQSSVIIEDETIIDKNNDTYTNTWVSKNEGNIVSKSVTTIHDYTKDNSEKIHESFSYGKKNERQSYKEDIFNDTPDVDCKIESRNNGELKQTINYAGDEFSIVHSSYNKYPLFIDVKSNGVDVKIDLDEDDSVDGPSAKITIGNTEYELIPVVKQTKEYDSKTNDLKSNTIFKRDYKDFDYFGTHEFEYERDELDRITKMTDSFNKSLTTTDYKYSIDEEGYECVEEETNVDFFLIEE